MKSLKESLFDNDIVEKEVCFGNYYKLVHFGFQDGNVYYTSQTPYNSMFSHIKWTGLKKKYKPADISNVQYGYSWMSIDYNEIKTYLEPLEYIVSFINSIEIASPDTFTKQYNFIHEFGSLLEEKIAPYLKDKKIFFGTYGNGDDVVVSICDRGGHRGGDVYTMNLKFEKK